ncbi:S41 family peptidase [Hahella sp. CR1]|uniref:S41 family peptidase n=1 Tax=Hahella sp. CR1 TaxID=2992807 RepID=UPI00244270C3|nr:S41 family peptidase [Hahella sp. CR1]MDG9666774.1 S41 family peptidase [Hahella sp. CR1]
MTNKRNNLIPFAFLMAAVSLGGCATNEGYRPESSTQQVSRQISTEQEEFLQVLSQVKQSHIFNTNIEAEKFWQGSLNRYLLQLDPERLALSQADINEIEKQHPEFSTLIAAGAISSAYQVGELYKQAATINLETAQNLVHDISLADFYGPLNSQEWAADAGQLRLRWKQHLTHDLRKLTRSGLTNSEATHVLEKSLQHQIERLKHSDNDQYFNTLVSSIMKHLDPWSRYFPAPSKDYSDSSLVGIGVALKEDTGLVQITKILPDSPAPTSTLKVGDRLVSLRHDQGPVVDLAGINLDEAVETLAAKKGAHTELTVIRDGAKIPILIQHKEVKIPLDRVSRYIEVIGLENQNFKIGVVKAPSFYSSPVSSADDIRAALKYIQNNHADGLIIDLRNNVGSILAESLKTSDLFLPLHSPMAIVNTDERWKVYDAFSEPQIQLPTVILVNENTAFGSETLTSALQEHGLAVVIGRRTSGNGIFCQSKKTKTGAVCIASAALYKINGESLTGKGIEPDLSLKLYPADILSAEKVTSPYNDYLLDSTDSVYSNESPRFDYSHLQTQHEQRVKSDPTLQLYNQYQNALAERELKGYLLDDASYLRLQNQINELELRWNEMGQPDVEMQETLRLFAELLALKK